MKIQIHYPAIILFLCFGIISCTNETKLKSVDLTCIHRQLSSGVKTESPLLGWKIFSSKENIYQSAYRIIVTDNPEQKNLPVWDSGKVYSEQSINIPYEGKKLKEGKRYFWKVKVWDNNGEESPWSNYSYWQSGLISKEAWQGAKWIVYEQLDSSELLVSGIHRLSNDISNKAAKRFVTPIFRKSFIIGKKPKSAILAISGLGHYVSFLNDKRIGDSFLAPGWTDYDKTIFYNMYDVTSMLGTGENVLGAIVGNGFYNINRERYWKLVINYGTPKLIAYLHLEYQDGTIENIVTDESWKTVPSPITFNSIYGGEDYDATQEQEGWKDSGFDDSAWKPALLTEWSPSGNLIAESDYPVKEMERFDSERISKLKDGSYLYDFGQNVSGIIELSIKGKKEQKVILWPSELLHTDSKANQQATGHPFYFLYTLKGDVTEMWKPNFTYYGFRYLQVEGAIPMGEKNTSGLPEIEKISLIHTRNSAPKVGSFLCSNDLLNRIYNLIDWAIKSNSQSVSTDCPHREKLGWLGQTSRMAKSINFSYDMHCLSRKIVYDMMDSQTPNGMVPNVSPEYVEFNGAFRDSPGSSSTAVILPYFLYKWYGDIQIIDEAWPMMMRYVNYLKSKSNQNILDYGYGDWFDLGSKRPGPAQLTPVSLTATAYYYYDVSLMSEMAKITMKPEAEMLQKWAEEIRDVFNAKFFDNNSKIYSTGSQTAMSLPYCMGLVDRADEDALFSNLVDSIIGGNKAITAGAVGFHFFIEALIKGHASNLFYEIINRDDVPGYGFQLKKGATTLTESWQALENVSNNHLMLGHAMEWFYAGLGGISQSEGSIGFKEIVINPEVVGDLKFVKAGFNCPYGLIRSDWKRAGNEFEIEVEIPVNTKAIIFLPTIDRSSVRVNGKKPDPKIISESRNQVKISVELGSGVYQLKSKLD